jgi:hypothetical protein
VNEKPWGGAALSAAPLFLGPAFNGSRRFDALPLVAEQPVERPTEIQPFGAGAVQWIGLRQTDVVCLVTVGCI